MAKTSALPMLAAANVDGSETLPVLKAGQMMRTPAAPFVDRIAAPYVAQAQAAAVLALSAGTLSYGSVRFPTDNGETSNFATVPDGDHGLLYLDNSNNLFRTSANYDTPFFAGAAAVGIILEIPEEMYNGLNRDPHIFGTQRASNPMASMPNRAMILKYERLPERRLVFGIRGESAVSAGAVAPSLAMPARRVLCVAKTDGANLTCDLFSLADGSKTAGTPVAMPAGWAGLAQLTGNLAFGGCQAGTFPVMTTSPYAGQTLTATRGLQAKHFVMVDGATTDAQWQAIALGADPVTVFTAATLRCHVPMATAGALDLAVRSNRAGLAGTSVKQLGNVYAGSSLTRQSSAKYFAVGPVPHPSLLGTTKTQAKGGAGEITYSGVFAGVSGVIYMRLRDHDTGEVLKGWRRVGVLPSAGSTWSVRVSIPFHPTDGCYAVEFEAGSDRGLAYRALVNAETWVVYDGVEEGQSEMTRVLDFSLDDTGSGNSRPLGKTGRGDQARKSFFLTWRDVGGVPYPVLRIARGNPNYFTDSLWVQFNRWGEHYSSRPIALINCAVPGTSVGGLLDDQNSTRSWAQMVAAASCLANRDELGRIPITATMSMHEAFYGQNANSDWVRDIAYPMIQGRPSAGPLAASYYGPAEIDHFFYDARTFNPDFGFAIMPANRGGIGAVGTTDASLMADKRKAMRDGAASVGAVSGAECATHLTEGTGGDGGTHQDTTSERGGPIMARAAMDSLARAFGFDRYAGPYLWGAGTFIDAGSGARTGILLPIGGAQTGSLDTFANLYAADLGLARVADPRGLEILGFEVSEGGGAFQRLDIIASAVIYSGRQVRIVKDSGAAWHANTVLRYHPGAPGDYGEGNAGFSNTAWVDGAAYFNGFEVAGDNSNIAVA